MKDASLPPHIAVQSPAGFLDMCVAVHDSPELTIVQPGKNVEMDMAKRPTSPLASDDVKSIPAIIEAGDYVYVSLSRGSRPQGNRRSCALQ